MVTAVYQNVLTAGFTWLADKTEVLSCFFAFLIRLSMRHSIFTVFRLGDVSGHTYGFPCVPLRKEIYLLTYYFSQLLLYWKRDQEIDELGLERLVF